MADPDQMTSSNPKTNKEISEGNPPKHGRINVLEQELAEPVEATTEAIKNRGKKRKMTTENDNGKWKADPAKENKKSKKSKKPEEKQLARTRTICSTPIYDHDQPAIYTQLLLNMYQIALVQISVSSNKSMENAIAIFCAFKNIGLAFPSDVTSLCHQITLVLNLSNQFIDHMSQVHFIHECKSTCSTKHDEANRSYVLNSFYYTSI
ncbi:unnamed protein product [Rhizophagus irregularis]|nr:unnamed protein product [Rhizophagus irregularis]